MISRRRHPLWLTTLALTLVAGTQFAGCFSAVGQYVSTFNPCGTLINCNPVTYDQTAAAWRFLTSGYEGPGVDADIDPACTYPPFCAGDPFAPGGPGSQNP